MKILIVEDDDAISNLIKMTLNIAGYQSVQAFDGLECLQVVEKETFDLILMDVMLPQFDGFELLHKIKRYNTPVIFLTAKDSVVDKVNGLRAGAEDYIVKPFEAIELLARIEVILRRVGKGTNVIGFGDLQIYEDERIVKWNGTVVDMTLKEFELLQLFVRNKNIALSREQILESVWGYDYFGETRTVDTHVQKLRKKLGLMGNIKTVFKVGYRLEE